MVMVYNPLNDYMRGLRAQSNARALGQATGSAAGPLPPPGMSPVERPKSFDPSADQKLQQGAVARPQTFEGVAQASADQYAPGNEYTQPGTADPTGLGMDGFQPPAPVDKKQTSFDKVSASQGTGFKSELGAGLVAGSKAAAESKAQTNGELLSSFFSGMGSGMYAKKVSNKQGEGMASLAKQFGLPEGIQEMARGNPEMFGKMFPDIYKAHALNSGRFRAGYNEHGGLELMPVDMEEAGKGIAKDTPKVISELQDQFARNTDILGSLKLAADGVRNSGTVFQTPGGFGDAWTKVGGVLGVDNLKRLARLNPYMTEERIDESLGTEAGLGILYKASMDSVLDYVQQTKGAISNAEMKLFANSTFGPNMTKGQNEALIGYMGIASIRENARLKWINGQVQKAGGVPQRDLIANLEQQWQAAVEEREADGTWRILDQDALDSGGKLKVKDSFVVNPFEPDRTTNLSSAGIRIYPEKKNEAPASSGAPQDTTPGFTNDQMGF